MSQPYAQAGYGFSGNFMIETSIIETSEQEKTPQADDVLNRLTRLIF